MALHPVVVEFDRGEPAKVVTLMGELAERRGGWINLQPDVDPDDIPPRGSFRLFSPQGPDVPLCTWKPPDDKPRGPKFVTLGIQHGAGMKAVPILDEHGVTVDRRWRVLSDANKRGLVIAVPTEDP